MQEVPLRTLEPRQLLQGSQGYSSMTEDAKMRSLESIACVFQELQILTKN